MPFKIPSPLGFVLRAPISALVLMGFVFGGSIQPAGGQAGGNAQDAQDTQGTRVSQSTASTQSEQVEHPNKEETEYVLAHSDRENMVWVPMRDGVRLSATLLFPKDKPRRKMPTVLLFNPYLTDSMIEWFAGYIESFLQNGYAVAFTNSRGRYFSEGTYTFLVGSGNDGYDTIDWLSKQAWSNGKVGTLGCSSSAEEQHKMNSMQHPALAAAVPMGSGAGIGKVGAYNEMGNFYRGGAIQNFWFTWYPGEGYKYKPSFPPALTREQMLRISHLWNLEPNIRWAADLDKLIWTLPINKITEVMGAAPSDLDDFVNWLPNDPRWKSIEFGGEGDRSGAPTLYINSFYDVSIGPNTAMYEYQTRNAANENARNNMFMVIAPTLHCDYLKTPGTEHTIVGERDMGDARFDYVGLVQRWFDRWVKGVENGVTKEPKVRAYLMGAGKWRSYDAWPPPSAKSIVYYLDGDGRANTLGGDGRLVSSPPRGRESDRYTYDPLHPTPSVGGQLCCFTAAVGGPFDQSAVESRPDVLVYTSPPLAKALNVTGPINISLYLSSDAKDTDLMVQLVDVYPDGRAFNLDEGVQRVRWREGYQKPIFMEPEHVYKIDIPPLVTSNSFGAGHRIRIAISSSAFPHFERNLNTGGNNFDEKDPIIAHNVIYHSPQYASRVVLSVVP